jgi:long-chain fatty acid transport protein
MRIKLAAVAVLLMVPSLSFGAGFALFETGARSWAMGGAFVAVADDPAAMFWNPAGLAFQTHEGSQFMLGVTFIQPEQDFEGVSPYPGDGYTASQVNQEFYVPHLYIVAPLGDRASFGFSILAPFGLGTWWEDDFAGRFISGRVDLETIDFSPNLAFKLTNYLSLGIGVDYRISTIDLQRDVPLVDPFAQEVVPVAGAHIYADGSDNDGWGWHAGFLADLGKGFSFGASYRSEVTVQYDGQAEFTQYATGNPYLDELVEAQIPVGETVRGTTEITYPDMWAVGLAWSNEKWTLSGQWSTMGWSVYDELNLVFLGYPEFNETLVENYEDADHYHAGLEFRATRHWRFQLGYEYDETPQPIESMTPLLGDADREVYTLGIGWQGKSFWLDLGAQLVTTDWRSTEGTSIVGFDGRYKAESPLFATSLGWKF